MKGWLLLPKERCKPNSDCTSIFIAKFLYKINKSRSQVLITEDYLLKFAEQFQSLQKPIFSHSYLFHQENELLISTRKTHLLPNSDGFDA